MTCEGELISTERSRCIARPMPLVPFGESGPKTDQVRDTEPVNSHDGDEHAEACARFEEYLNVLGLEHDYEPDLGTSRKPDFLVATTTGPIVCEVKAFRLQPIPPEGFYVRGMREVPATSSNSIRTAAGQLRTCRTGRSAGDRSGEPI